MGRKTLLIRTNIGVLECEEIQEGLYKTKIGRATAELSKIPANPFNGNTENVID